MLARTKSAKNAYIIASFLMIIIQFSFAQSSWTGFALKGGTQSSVDKTCWAYCVQTILLWYHKPQTRQVIISYGTNGVNAGLPYYNYGSPCTDNIKSSSCVLTNFEVSHTPVGGIISFSSIKESIDNRKPIYASISWSGTVYGHALVICGYYENNSGVKTVYYYDPAYGVIKNESYDALISLHNSVYTSYNGSLYTGSAPASNCPSTSTHLNGYRQLMPTDGGGQLGNEINVCSPFALPVVGEPCTISPYYCGENVHGFSTQLWFGNYPGNVFRCPISFPKKGIYTITLTCRGSVCATETFNDCCSKVADFAFPVSIREVKDVATVGLSSTKNEINGNNKITGTSLDRVVYGSNSEVKCRPYTCASAYTPGDIDISFTAYIYEPAVENITVTLLSGVPGTVGLSLHKIQTSFTRDFIYGCNDPNANNYNSNADINDGSCVYPQPPAPPPPPPPYARTFSFTGKRSDWPYREWCGSLWGYCEYRFKKFKIVWGDNSDPIENSNWNAYVDVTFTHVYKKMGTFKPYVEITYYSNACPELLESGSSTATIQLGMVAVSNITPIINLLLND